MMIPAESKEVLISTSADVNLRISLNCSPASMLSGSTVISTGAENSPAAIVTEVEFKV